MNKFSVRLEDGKEGRDGQPSVGPVYGSPATKNEDISHEICTSWDIFSNSVRKYPGNQMLGWREFKNEKAGHYLWKTYKEVYAEVLDIGSALRASGAEPGCTVGIYGSNCPEWIVTMETCNGHSLICVPLYDTLGMRAVDFIINHAEINFVFVQNKKANEVWTVTWDYNCSFTDLLRSECASSGQLKLVVCFTDFTREQRDTMSALGIKAYSWNEFRNMGKENPIQLHPAHSHDICTIMYTSGTSGDPKGVSLTHDNIVHYVNGMDLFMDQFEDKMTMDDVYLSFLPLAHILDRTIEEYFFHRGASVGYYQGDLNAISDDLNELKPTLFAGVPRVFERVHEGVLTALEELNPRRRKIFDLLYKYKLYWMKLGYGHRKASPLADLLAFRKVKQRLGGRIRLIISGGAPLSTEIEEFLRVTSCSFVVQGYGLTETCGSASCCYPDDMQLIGTVGVPSVFSEIRLEEVLELGYDPLAIPSRGEICIRGKAVFYGYHKNPELTREVMKDGWFHTGDIGEMSPDGILKIIDRRKNIFKLSQGEYVAVEYLETIYGGNPIVDEIWVYGDSKQAVLVAVVVPNEANTKKWAELKGHMGSITDLCKLDQLRDHILLELKTIANVNKLKGFEYIKGVVLDPCPFSIEQDLITPTMKKKRSQLLKHYQVGIDQLYTGLTGKKIVAL